MEDQEQYMLSLVECTPKNGRHNERGHNMFFCYFLEIREELTPNLLIAM